MKKTLTALFFILLILPSIIFAEEYSMVQAIDRGLISKKDLQFNEAELQLQTMAITEQIRSYFPKLSVQYQNNNSVVLNGADTKIHALSLSANQLIFDGGKLANTIENSKISLYLANLDYLGKRTDSIYGIADLYLNILRQQEKIKIKNDQMNNTKKEMVVSQKQNQIGETTSLDLLEWEIEADQQETDLKQMESEMEDALLQFRRLLSLSEEDEVHFSQKLKLDIQLQEIPEDSSEYYKDVLASSTELKKMEMSINQSRNNSFKNNLFIPTIQLNGSYSMDFITNHSRLFGPEDSWNVGLSISIPAFFDSITANGGLSGNVKGSIAGKSYGASSTVFDNAGALRSYISGETGLEQAVFNLEEKKKDIKVEVEKVLRDLRFQTEKERLAVERLKLSLRKEVILKEQLRLGEIRLSEYIQFENSLNTMQNDKLEAIYQYVSLQLKLKKMRGKLTDSELTDFYEEFLE